MTTKNKRTHRGEKYKVHVNKETGEISYSTESIALQERIEVAIARGREARKLFPRITPEETREYCGSGTVPKRFLQ